MVFGHSVAAKQQQRQAGHTGGREQESNLPGAAEQPQPALKAGRPTGAASLPSASIRRCAQLSNERCLVGRLQAAAVEPEAAFGEPANHGPRQLAQPG